MEVLIHLAKAFTQNKNEGNPAGVVLDANTLTHEQMLVVTRTLGFGESAFVQTSDQADYKLRLFSVVGEVQSCVTAMLAAASFIQGTRVTFETKAGIREVYKQPDGLLMAKQPPVQFIDANIDKANVATLLRIAPNALMDYPIEIATVGTPKLLIPVRSLADLFAIQPDLENVAKYCEKIGARGFYPFTLETKEAAADFHARQFNPQDNIAEDPVTGVAAAALVAYMRKYAITTKRRLIGEQGYIIGKPGEIIIEITEDAMYVGGYTARYGERTVYL